MENKAMIEISTGGKNSDICIVSFGSTSISGISDIDQISEQLRQFITASKPGKMVIDFADVRFFSSQLLGLLVDVWRRLKDYDGVLLICGINPRLNRVFKITSLDRIFDFYPDRAGAIEALDSKIE